MWRLTVDSLEFDVNLSTSLRATAELCTGMAKCGSFELTVRFVSHVECSLARESSNNFQFSMLTRSLPHNISDRDQTIQCAFAFNFSLPSSLFWLFDCFTSNSVISILIARCSSVVDDHVTSHFLYCNCTTCSLLRSALTLNGHRLVFVFVVKIEKTTGSESSKTRASRHDIKLASANCIISSS